MLKLKIQNKVSYKRSKTLYVNRWFLMTWFTMKFVILKINWAACTEIT